MRTYFLSDVHMGIRGQPANDFNEVKEELFLDLLQVIHKERDALVIAGDLIDSWAANPQEVIHAYLQLLRYLAVVIQANPLSCWIRGNHDPCNLSHDWVDRLRLGGSQVLELGPGYKIWAEHGHAFDPSWQRGAAIKAAARALYRLENLPRCAKIDEQLVALLRRYQDWVRRRANKPKDNRLPYWGGAVERAKCFPDVRGVVFGHSHRHGKGLIRGDSYYGIPPGSVVCSFCGLRGAYATMGVEPNTRPVCAVCSWPTNPALERETIYVNTGTWARDDHGRQCEDVTVYDSEAGSWWQGNVRELI